MEKSHSRSQEATYELEARLFTRHITGNEATQQTVARYVKLITPIAQSDNNPADQKLLTWVVARPWSLPFLDSYAAFFKPQSELRHRLYVLFAILESSPEFADSFLPQKRRLLPSFVRLTYAGVAATFKLLVGTILAKAVL